MVYALPPFYMYHLDMLGKPKFKIWSLSKNCGQRNHLKIAGDLGSGPAGSYLKPEIDLNAYISYKDVLLCIVILVTYNTLLK